VLTTEDSQFAGSSDAGLVANAAVGLEDGITLRFKGPSAVILRGI
jgi:hypothetical protein